MEHIHVCAGVRFPVGCGTLSRMNDIPRIPYRGMTNELRVYGDDLVANFPGGLSAGMAYCFRPKPEEIRQALLALRRECEWPRGFLAAVLGVPTATLRRWETGERNPSGAARKLIWLLHRATQKEIGSFWEVAYWGKGYRIKLG